MRAPAFSARLMVPVALFACLFAFGLFLPSIEDTLPLELVGIPFLAVGALVVHKRPDNPLGWLFLGFAGVAAAGATGFPYWASGLKSPQRALEYPICICSGAARLSPPGVATPTCRTGCAFDRPASG